MLMEIRELSIDMIDEPGREIRSVTTQENFEKLIESIKRLGVLEPIKVKEVDGRYEIIYGNRRFLAARQAGLATIPAIVADGESAADVEEMVHENLMREDLNPLDLANWLAQVKRVEGLSNETLSARFGFSRGWAEQYLALLRCDDEIQRAVGGGKIDMVSARRLQTVKNPDRRQALLESAVRGGASQSVIAGWVAQEQVAEGTRPAVPRASGALDQADEKPPELKFICLWCNGQFSTEKMITARFCPECYGNLNLAIIEERKLSHEVQSDRNDRPHNGGASALDDRSGEEAGVEGRPRGGAGAEVPPRRDRER